MKIFFRTLLALISIFLLILIIVHVKAYADIRRRASIDYAPGEIYLNLKEIPLPEGAVIADKEVPVNHSANYGFEDGIDYFEIPDDFSSIPSDAAIYFQTPTINKSAIVKFLSGPKNGRMGRFLNLQDELNYLKRYFSFTLELIDRRFPAPEYSFKSPNRFSYDNWWGLQLSENKDVFYTYFPNAKIINDTSKALQFGLNALDEMGIMPQNYHLAVDRKSAFLGDDPVGGESLEQYTLIFLPALNGIPLKSDDMENCIILQFNQFGISYFHYNWVELLMEDKSENNPEKSHSFSNPILEKEVLIKKLAEDLVEGSNDTIVQPVFYL